MSAGTAVYANTAQCAYVAKLLVKMSADIGENDIARKYNMVYNQYKKAWQEIGCGIQLSAGYYEYRIAWIN